MSHHEETFDKITALGSARRFESCAFKNCNLGYANLADVAFIDCVFEQCNLSLANLGNTALQEVSFKDCKLSGLDFSKIRGFGFKVSFERCQLDDTVFFKCKLKGTSFISCSLKGADFTETDLTQVVLDNCDLEGTTFERTNLKEADLRTAYNFIINPEKNTLRKARFSTYGLPGLLAGRGIIIE